MNKWIVPIVLLVVSICIITMAIFALRKDEFPNVKNKTDCEDESKSKLPKSCQTDSKCCAIWQNGMCRKGKLSGDRCESKGDVLPLLLFLVSIGFFIASVIYLVKAIKQK